MSKELELAKKAAQEAGKILVAGWETDLATVSKADNSLVTKIDRESEEKIISIIQEVFPAHKIVGEEGGESGNSDFSWHIDPIDGTTNYSRRIPICAVSIGLVKDNLPIVGVLFNPFTQELYWAEKGQGAYLNDKKIITSAETTVEKSIVAVSYSHSSEVRELMAHKTKLLTKCRTKREYGSAAYELGLLASGRLDALFLADHHSWDLAGGMIIVTEAGGVMTDASGQETDINTQYLVGTANTSLHQQFLEILK